MHQRIAQAGALIVGIAGFVAIAPSASAAPAAAATTTTTIEDTSSAVTWGGQWGQCSGNCSAASDGSFKWSGTVGSTATVKFTGNKISLYGMKEPWDNIATVSIDGGATTDVDYYAKTATTSTVSVYTSPLLTDAAHTLTLTMTSRRNKNATSDKGISITFDKAVVTSNISPAGHTSGLPWSSGVGLANEHSDQFATFRGAALDNVEMFPFRDNWTTISDPATFASWLPTGFNATRDDMVVSVGLWPQSNDINNTGTQAQWQNLAKVIAADDPNAFIRLGWEMNLPSFPWMIGDGTKKDYDGNVIPDNQAKWKADFIQAVTWMKAAAPNLRFVWNPNYGGDQTCSNNCSRLMFQAVKQYVDVYGIDSYDDWNPDLGAAGTTEHLARLSDTMNYAVQNGKKWAIPEWGVMCNDPGCALAGHAGGDNPQFIHDYLTFFKNNASSLAFESYFDESAASTRSALDITPIGPLAPAKYQADIKAYKIS